MVRVLFVSPFAHYHGHYGAAAIKETGRLSTAFQGVTLLTFAGLASGIVHKNVQHYSVLPSSPRLRGILSTLNSHRPTKWPIQFFTSLLTFVWALYLRSRDGYEIVHLRDADPFVFLPQLLGLFSRHVRWLVSLLSPPKRTPIVRTLIKFSLWKSIYRSSLQRNAYLYICQNDATRKYYDQFLGGVLSGRVFTLPLMALMGTEESDRPSREVARRKLGLPDGVVILSFGSVHAGKDLETVFRTFDSRGDVFLVHAGKPAEEYRLRFEALKKNYRVNGVIRDDFVPEEERKFYLSAASALVLSYAKDYDLTASMLWEACGYRIPVIASDNNQLGDLVRSYGIGIVFEAGSSRSLENAIDSFLGFSEEDLSRIGSNWEKFYADFSPSTWIKNCRKLYEKLMASTPA